uniref:Putative secreted protein n=1 Tax=Anopheles darlingi TaxID=43151 RepID=A0A2M4DGP4_ANODA
MVLRLLLLLLLFLGVVCSVIEVKSQSLYLMPTYNTRSPSRSLWGPSNGNLSAGAQRDALPHLTTFFHLAPGSKKGLQNTIYGVSLLSLA